MSHRAFDGSVTANTTASGTGAATTIRAQNATGTTSIGGRLNLSSGSGTSTDGYITLQSGGVTKLNIYSNPAATQTFLEFDAAVNGPRITQAATGGATGTNLNIIAQSAATQGGRIILQPGAGATGGSIRMLDGNTGNNAIEFTTLSTGGSAITYVATVTQPTYTQSPTSTGNGSQMRFVAQTSSFDTGTGGAISLEAGAGTGVTTATGGSASISAGAGTTANGSVNIRVGPNNLIVFGPNPNPNGAVDMNWVNTITTPRIIHATNTSPNAVGVDFTIIAQSCSGTTSTGGNLKLRGGTGTSQDGYVSIFGGSTESARAISNKWVFQAGMRNKTTAVAATPYTVLSSDRFLLVDTSSLTITVNLPTTPILGDTYTIKDSTGAAATRNITVSGNGTNIEGIASQTINTNFGRISVMYNGTQWVML